MEVTWIGQSGYMLALNGTTLLIDPYLSNSLLSIQGLQRLIPVPINLTDHHIDFVYCTHNHLDHFDPETINSILNFNHDCKIIGPISVIAHAEKLGIAKQNLIMLNCYQKLEMNGFKLIATPTYHSDAFGTGLIVETDTCYVYFSGDTTNEPQLAKEIISITEGKNIDAVFVCINGMLGNMNIDDAVKLGIELHPKIIIPNHYGLFAENTVDPDLFGKCCIENGVSYKIMDLGECLPFTDK